MGQCKEHALVAGRASKKNGKTAIDVIWNGDDPEHVPIEWFDFDSLDSLEDQCRELLAAGKPITPLLERRDRLLALRERTAGANFILAEIVTSPRPRYQAQKLAFVCGSDTLLGLDGPAIAAKEGESKQSFFEDVGRLRAQFGSHLLELSNVRDAEARAAMRGKKPPAIR